MTTLPLYGVYLPMVKKVARGEMPLGTAIHAGYFCDPRYTALLVNYLDVTPEVDGGYWWVYGGPDYPAHGWGNMDYLYQYAASSNKRLISYPLRWWFPNSTVQPPDIEAWITEAMARYPLISEWIVVNEGYWDGLETIPLIDDSYRIARQLRPDDRLWYNGLLFQEYEQEQAKRLITSGLADCIGIQMHVNINFDLTQFYPLLGWLRDNHVPWRVTEMDVEIPELSEWCLSAQAAVYGDVLNLCRDYGAEGLSTWGIDDGHSWLSQYYPLPFGSDYQPKPAWASLIQQD